MLTQAPLPRWSTLIRAALRSPPSDDDLARHWHRDGELAGWLSRSAWSLALVALWRKRLGAAEVTVWIPDFFCNSSLLPLRQLGVRLAFYPLNAQFAPDISAVRKMADGGAPDLFLLVHYFGQPVPAAPVREFCNRHGAWLVEDAAHVLRPVEGVGQAGDFVLYSPHKHLPVPDGAVLAVRASVAAERGESLGPPSTWSAQLDEALQRPGSATHRRGPSLLWSAKRILQKVGVRRTNGQTPPFIEPTADAFDNPVRLPPPGMSHLSRRLLGCLVGDLDVESRKRHRHQLLWNALLASDDAAGLAVPVRPAQREWAPYLAAFDCPRETIESTYARWEREGLPVTTWPDLPPEVISQREDLHSGAWRARHSRLYLPVHGSLDPIEMGRHRQASNERREARLTVTWDGATRDQWQAWITQAGRSNLLQSWGYGAAKAATSRWRVTRGVLSEGGQPTAIVQVLRRRIGPFQLSRINRGPLFLDPTNADQRRRAWDELSTLGSLRRGRMLSTAPDLALDGTSLGLMTELGFRQAGVEGIESAWIDLSLDLEALRKRLNGKWRNMLVAAEKSGLELEAGTGSDAFLWLLAQYSQMRSDVGFDGPALALLSKLAEVSDPNERMLTLCALHEGARVAGICVAEHGSAATYLIGWNGEKGRTLRANNYLLWQAIVHLKQAGFRWFDLGGISDRGTPGVAAFKRGLNGEPYELVGEYRRW